MSKGNRTEAVSAPASAIYKVQYSGCPIIYIEAFTEQEAAAKYRDRFDLHYSRLPVVEKYNGGDRRSSGGN